MSQYRVKSNLTIKFEQLGKLLLNFDHLNKNLYWLKVRIQRSFLISYTQDISRYI